MSSGVFLSVLCLLLLSWGCASPAIATLGEVATQDNDGKEGSAPIRRIKSRSSLQIYLGGRSFSDDSLWSPVEDQLVMGSEFDWIAAEGVLGFEIGVQASFGSETTEVGVLSIDHRGSSSELYLGPRFDTALFGSSLHIVGGAGPSLLYARRSREASNSLRSSSEGSLGIYAHAGLMLDLGDIGLGLDYRGRWGEEMTGFEDVFGTQVTGDADYGQLALTLALQF